LSEAKPIAAMHHGGFRFAQPTLQDHCSSPPHPEEPRAVRGLIASGLSPFRRRRVIGPWPLAAQKPRPIKKYRTRITKPYWCI